MLNGKKTYLVAIVGALLGAAQAMDIQIPAWVWPILGALGLGFLRAGVAKAVAKTAPLILAVLAIGCSTTGPSDQMAGQQPVRGTSSAWNSVATTEAAGTLRDTLGRASEGVEIPLLDKDGKPVLTPEGKPVTIVVGRGLRDVNLFFGETTISAETTVSGSAAGNTLPNAPAPSNTPNVPVNVSGLPTK